MEGCLTLNLAWTPKMLVKEELCKNLQENILIEYFVVIYANQKPNFTYLLVFHLKMKYQSFGKEFE